MKKNHTHLIGILFLIVIMIAGGCNTTVKTDEAETSKDRLIDSLLLASKKINITCKAVADDEGNLQFTMADKDDIVVGTLKSKDDPLTFVANDTTEVKPNKTVVWQWAKSSQVKEFVIISPKESGGNIMPGDAVPIEPDSRKKFKYDIPGDAKKGVEKYIIQFIWNNETITIDPYLKVPKQQ